MRTTLHRMTLNWKRILQQMPLVILGITIPFQALPQQTVGLFKNDTASFDGYTLIAPLLTDTTYLIDNCGYKVHSWTSTHRPGFSTQLLENGHLLRTGKIPSNIFFGGGTGGLIQEIDWDGNVVWNYQFADDTKHQHHDVEPMPNGNILLLSWAYISAAEAQAHGKKPTDLQASFWPTLITEVQPIYPDSAVIVWEWNAWDHLVQDFDPTKPNYGVIAEHPELIDINQPSLNHQDWLHCNSVKYNPILDQIVMSSRNCGEIYVIDHSTTWAEAGTHQGGNQSMGGDIIYRWGNPKNYQHGAVDDQILFHPHDAHWIADSLKDKGKIFIFNNGGGSNGSAVELISPPFDQTGSYSYTTGTAFGPTVADWRYEAQGFSSGHTSGAQRLPNGNTLICEGDDGNIFELNEQDSIVWQYVNPAGGAGNITQGSNPNQQSSLFRAIRYPANYSGLNGRDLVPTTRIELQPYPSDCEITPEPVDTGSIKKIHEPATFNVSVNGLITNILTVHVGIPDQYLLQAYDINGRVIHQQNIENGSYSILVDDWPSGLYIVAVSSRITRNAQFFKTIKL